MEGGETFSATLHRAAFWEGGLTKRSPLKAVVPRTGATQWVPGALSSRVPLGALSSWVLLGALSSWVPLGALSSWVPLGAPSPQVPLGVLSAWVPCLGVAECSLLGIDPIVAAPPQFPHPNLITSQRPHLHLLSHRGLRLQHMNFEGTQTCRQQQGSLLSTWYVLTV